MFLFVSTLYAEPVPHFTILTEEWEPYNFQDKDTVKGISTDMLVLMLKKLGSTQGRDDINIFPWVRAYKIALKEPNTILFTTARTDEREKLFKWVGPIFEIEFNVYALKSRHIKINSFDDLRKYKIGTLRGDVTEDLLIKKAGCKISDLIPVASNIQNTKKLSVGRIDCILQSKDTLMVTCQKARINPELIEKIVMLDKKYMYYAFSNGTSDSVITLFQKEFDDLKKEGKLSEIFHNYHK
jgi:polar amino acid transport system substrate-binding protein